MRSLPLLFVATLASSSACLVTAQPAPGTTVPREEGTPGPSQGIIEGVVTDSVTHEGLARVAIDVMFHNKPVGTAATDDTGHFRMPPMQPGDYQMRARREQYNPIEMPHVTVNPGDDPLDLQMVRHR